MDFSLGQLRQDLQGLTPEEHGFTYLDLDRSPTASGRLDGWVLSAKDLADVKGMRTTLGHIDRAYTATATDPFLAQLESEGAVIIGKSAAPELGLMVDTEPIGLPHPDNPLWPGRTPGGSSGGAAVQVARGLLRAAHAGDGGGSIRVPAAACGVVGFKPGGDSLAVDGFITRTVADAAFLHDIHPLVPRARIGVLTEPLFIDTRVDPVMLEAVREAEKRLRARGFDVVHIGKYPQANTTFESFRHIFTSHLANLDEAEGYVDWIRALGRRVSPKQLALAKKHGTALQEILTLQWRVDAIVSPMLAFDPPRHGTFRALPHEKNFEEQTRWSPWGSLFNVAHLSAISVPWTLDNHQPVGLQLGAITLSEPELLGLATVLHP